MSASFEVSGSFDSTESWLKKLIGNGPRSSLEAAGARGVSELAAATPKDTGKTAQSWDYEIEYNRGVWSLIFVNRNVQNGTNIALILDKGHGTGTGGYVRGLKFVDPVLAPVFEKLLDDAWKAVTS